MKASDLRIGNYVLDRGKPVILKRSQLVNIITGKYVDEYQPIPITEEILLKCGFEKQMAWTFSIDLIGNIKFIYYLGEKGWSLGNKNYSDFSNLKYLHQLQNLYWCLCGEELTVKL